MARLEGRKGDVWDTKEPEGYGRKVNMSQYMMKYRFEQIKSYIPFLFANEQRRGEDPWWQFSEAVEEYNKNRQNTVLASSLKVFDESMSAYRPRTTKTGNLPHLSKIDRKPEPLGTELKVTASCFLNLCIYLEIQKGKTNMQGMEFHDVIPMKTTACCAQMVKGTKMSDSIQEDNQDKKRDLPWRFMVWFRNDCCRVEERV